jgi:hypothetical protein
MPLPGFASGTLDAPDMFVAGEKGPELIVGAGGSMVFPAEATSDILMAAGRVPVSAEAPSGMEGAPAQGPFSQAGGMPGSRQPEEKKITLNINGTGALEVGGNYNEDKIWDLMSSNLRPILIGMLKREIFEEGDRAYAF